MEPRSEPRTRRAGSPVKVKKKSTAKHTVKFKDQARDDVLVVTVEPPSPSPGSPEPSPKTAVTFALPPIASVSYQRPKTGGEKPPTTDTRALPKEKDPTKRTAKPADSQRLAEGCTSLMYACQQGLTGDILKELRQKVRDILFCSPSHTPFCSPFVSLVSAVAFRIVPLWALCRRLNFSTILPGQSSNDYPIRTVAGQLRVSFNK